MSEITLPSGAIVRVRHMSAKVAHGVMVRCKQVFAPAVAKESPIAIPPSSAYAALLATSDPDSLDFLDHALAGATEYSAGPGLPFLGLSLDAVYESAFGGKHADYVAWMAHAIGFNFASFFAATPGGEKDKAPPTPAGS